VSLGVDQQVPVIETPGRRRKSAGIAFVLCLFIAGAGQVYDGKVGRGLITFLIFALALWVIIGLGLNHGKENEEVWGLAVLAVLVLYIFSFLDGYFSACEINACSDTQVDVHNPRVAATLNLLTNGLGHVYLGEHRKGFVLFVLLGTAERALSQALDSSPCTATADSSGYVIGCLQAGTQKLKEAQDVEPVAAAMQDSTRFESGLPPAVPVSLACLLLLGLIGLAAIGLAMPKFDPIDESRAVIRTDTDPKSYENPKYGVRMLIPSNWEFESSGKGSIVTAKTFQGGCQVQLLGYASIPVRSVGQEVDNVTREILQENPNFKRIAGRRLELAGLDATEVELLARVHDTDVSQHYLKAGKKLAVYALITTVAASFREKCDPDADWIRRSM
jgi:TM2 domain-containing membrane protein YozV